MSNNFIANQIPVGLSHLSYYLPPQVVSIEQLAEQMAMPDEEVRLYRDVHGLEFVHIAQGETTGDMAVKAARQVIEDNRIDPESIDAVILFYTAFTTSLEPNTIVGRIQRELRLKRATGFSIWEQYCASIITAMRVAQDMIRTSEARTILLVGADCFFGSTNRAIDGITIQGEGSSAVIVKGDCEINRLVAITSHVDGSFYRTSACTQDDLERFNLVYFLATTRTIQRTLKKAGLTLDDISLIIPHNINLSSWDRVLSMLKCDKSKLFSENVKKHAHVFGSDIVINLRDATDNGSLRKGEHALLMTAGLGASWGCAIVQH
ncbi:MAG TPA: 3-oxoacyl-ACP synthase III family protein [Blastocatellia bacterium]|jgi:3-oxoacyl-[acyl-carrier-protein] synthase-3